MDENNPEELFIIEDLETLRVLADPLRNQIYELLIPTAANVRQIAEKLGTSPSRLYYHMNLLEKHGLIRVVETRMVANMVEKVYRAAATKIDLAPGLLNFATDESREAVYEMVTSSLDTTREDMLRSVQARLVNVEQGGAPKKQRQMTITRVTARVPDSYADEFHQRLHALVEEFLAKDSPTDPSGEQNQNYALLVALYPSFYYEDRGSNDE